MAKPKSSKSALEPPVHTPAASLDELRFRRAVQQSITQRILSTTPLPDLAPPSLDGLQIPLQPLDLEVTDADLLDWLGRVAAENAPRRPRTIREPIAPRDELTLNIVGYCQGAIIPFTFRNGVILEHRSGAYLPGFAEGLQDAKVGDALQVRLALPPDFGVVALRGLPAVFAVSILGASELLSVDPTSEQFLFNLGLGQSHEELFASIEQDILEVRNDKAIQATLDKVFEALHQRAPPNIPSSLIDEEIGRRWRRFEGDHLAALHVPAQDQDGALASWLNDANLRSDIRRGLARTQLLLAVAAGEKLLPTRDEFVEMIAEGAVLADADLKQVLREMRADPEFTRRVTLEAMTRKAISYLLTRCVQLEAP